MSFLSIYRAHDRAISQVEKRCFRFRFCTGYLTETWISADGIVTGNTCIRHVSVSADTLKRIPYTRVSVRFTLAETLTAVMFPQLVNSEDTQLSVEFPEQWMRKLSLTGLLSAAFMFPQIPLSVDYSLDFLNVLTFLNHPVSNHMFILSGIWKSGRLWDNPGPFHASTMTHFRWYTQIKLSHI